MTEIFKESSIILHEHTLSVIQKCYLPEKYSQIFSDCPPGCYVCVKLSNDRCCVCKLFFREDVHMGFCHVDCSVMLFHSISESTAGFPNEKLDYVAKGVSVKNIETVPCVAIKELHLSVVFDSFSHTKNWNRNLNSLEEIVRDFLSMYIVASKCVVYLKNINSNQRFGTYCIVIHKIHYDGEIRELVLGRAVSSTKIHIYHLLSKLWYEEMQSFSGASVLGGLDIPSRKLKSVISNCVASQKIAEQLRMKPSTQVLLIGPSGCGKTSLVREVAAECGAALLTVLGPEVFNAKPGDTESSLRKVFEEAASIAEEGASFGGICVLLLDEVDSLCPRRGRGISSHVVRASTQLLTLLEEANNIKGLVIVATTSRPQALDPAIRRPGRLETEIYIGVPTEDERLQILKILSHRMVPTKILLELCSQVSRLTPGYVGADLSLLCQDVALQRHRKKVDASSMDLNEWLKLYKTAVSKIKPSALRGGLGIITTKSKMLSDIGGIEKIKKSLRSAVEWPLLHPEVFAKFGLPPPKGVLLYGPPGCAKTSLARAIATATNTTFLCTSAAELYSPYVGDAEKSIAELFHRARLGAPTILFIDEIDALVGSRGQREKGVQERVLSALLTEMDGIGISLQSSPARVKSESTSSAGVVVIAATNRPDMLDDALLRPGRFDKLLYIPAPDKKDRLNILQVLTAAMPLDVSVDLEALAEATHLFSGADLGSLCKEAALYALTEDGMEVEKIRQRHFLKVLAELRPSLSQQQITWYESYSNSKS